MLLNQILTDWVEQLSAHRNPYVPITIIDWLDRNTENPVEFLTTVIEYELVGYNLEGKPLIMQNVIEELFKSIRIQRQEAILDAAILDATAKVVEETLSTPNGALAFAFFSDEQHSQFLQDCMMEAQRRVISTLAEGNYQSALEKQEMMTAIGILKQTLKAVAPDLRDLKSYKKQYSELLGQNSELVARVKQLESELERSCKQFEQVAIGCCDDDELDPDDEVDNQGAIEIGYVPPQSHIDDNHS